MEGKLTEEKKKRRGHTYTKSFNPTILRLKKQEITDLKPEVSQGGYTHPIQWGILQSFSIWDWVHEELTLVRCAQELQIYTSS